MTDRKRDHIDLAFRSHMENALADKRFYYEPLLSAHPDKELEPFGFLGKQLCTPIWVSSMTGGTEKAAKINLNLARACAQFGMGMGLGSCRSLLDSKAHFADFDIRSVMGDDLPLYANLGICQIETLIKDKALDKIEAMLQNLRADGLIVHINPMQESLQPEGDRLYRSPIETLKDLMSQIQLPLIVKEVGQGMGPKSLEALMNLPLQAIEFGAFGGTNFAKLELMRHPEKAGMVLEGLSEIGHNAEEMLEWTNRIYETSKSVQCKELIISGGISSCLDGYYLMKKSKMPAIYGQASALLKHAQGEYADLERYIQSQIKGLQLAEAYLDLR
ncbi:type 2 isopentenyl-diphosphate Delta-isomerase [Ancylomarina salipaludis]|uniref:Type 2 isopentenyl-diphosphate Delta-isomerase n=1 Tax=Ancylomarina salipaludis TaxID=2501299 RepID=A0A4Q1JLA7_9BACT|nr:type 2 isopentenyl-diphosphate Delta-isomerase [Ancylomarina salipaludis]RXQ92951.1 type 2 isopentenyl-diphosphate Delta-isomerase [Ancylomarina salipaludis]